MTVVVGDDGAARCPWGDAPADLRAYHDIEWGRRVDDPQAVFERICLELMQSGLSWLTILRRREGMRQAYDGFDPQLLAQWDADRIAATLADPRVIRNRRKVEAVVTCARAALSVNLAEIVHSYASDRPAPQRLDQVPASTDASAALARQLRAAGFTHLGPVTCYAAMQAVGAVNDHLSDCHVRGDVESLRGRPG
jgi:DNA-3-methyladenine glycosylase I